MVARLSARRRSVRTAVFVVVVGVGAVCPSASGALPGSPASVLRPTRAPETLGEVRLSPQPGCIAGSECAVSIMADLRPVAGDRRRVAFVFDWPAQPAPRSEGPWRCRPLTEGETVCFARPDEVAVNPVSRLFLRLPSSFDSMTEPKLCPRPMDDPYRGIAFGPQVQADTRKVRLLQVFNEEAAGAAPLVPSGRLAGETRQTLMLRARLAGLPTDSEAEMVAALLGQEVNRMTAALPGCVALITPAARPQMVETAVARPKPPPPNRNAAAGNANDADLPFPWTIKPLNGLRKLFGG